MTSHEKYCIAKDFHMGLNNHLKWPLICLFVLCILPFHFHVSVFAQSVDCDFDEEIVQFFEKPIAPNEALVDSGGRYFALLVGINDYNSPNLVGVLQQAEPEIDTLAGILKNQGYNIKTLKGRHATRQNVLKWLACCKERLNIDDRVLFYFAGHAKGLYEMRGDLAYEIRPHYRARIKAIGRTRKTGQFKDNLCLLLYQHSPKAISPFLEAEEIAALLSAAPANQKVMIIDACYGGEIDRIFHLPLDVFSHRLRNDGFFALTSAKRPVQDGLTAPFFFQALRGAADDTLAGNGDGVVNLYEATIYMDHLLHKVKSDTVGEPYKSRYIFVGSGEVKLTAAEKTGGRQ